MTFVIDAAPRTGCGSCIAACPAGAVTFDGDRARIDEAHGAGCRSCAEECPVGAVTASA